MEPSTASNAVGAAKGTLVPNGPVASAVTWGGIVRIGGVVSRTVIVNDAVPLFPALSIAVHVTVVDPSGKVAPLI